MKLMLTAVAACVALLVGAGAAHGDDGAIGEPPACGSNESSLSAVDCGGIEPVPALGPLEDVAVPEGALEAGTAREPLSLDPNCRLHSEVLFYAASDWLRLAQSLVADQSHCADFYVSIPPLAADKTVFRPVQSLLLKALGPNVHPMAEIHLAGWTSWRAQNGKTWYETGVEARRRAEAANYEEWALNEIPSSVRRNDGASRVNLLAFLRGLHDGPGGDPQPGLVFTIGIGQDTTPTSVYHATLKGWLQDQLWWSAAGTYVKYFTQEVYADSRLWGVDGAPRNTRARYLNDYLQHLLTLARAGGALTAAAQETLERTYAPLGNAAWSWQSGFGNTMLTTEQMASFVSEQVYAVRHFAGSSPQGAPSGRFGMAWAPRNAGLTNAQFQSATAALLLRLASAVHESYANGGGSPMGACGPPGGHVWCGGTVEGAAFSELWSPFAHWEYRL